MLNGMSTILSVPITASMHCSKSLYDPSLQSKTPLGNMITFEHVWAIIVPYLSHILSLKSTLKDLGRKEAEPLIWIKNPQINFPSAST